MKSIKIFLSFVGDQSLCAYTNKTNKADLVIFTDIHGIAKKYDKNKSYVYLKIPNDSVPQLPDNCVMVNPLKVVGLIDVIAKTHKKLVLTDK